MKNLFFNYFNSFSGLSKEVWWLSLITLINRAGTMVIPFLSLYLTKDLQLSLIEIGWIMTCFGTGSLLGSWLGGKLTDKIGYYKVMYSSLIATGFGFIILQFLDTFLSFSIGIFIIMILADTFRPATFVALNSYSKPENKTRSVTLIRLAINLGFSAGPAVGGIIITTIGYQGLFWVDGITCLLASVLLLYTLNPKTTKTLDNHIVENPVSVYRDKTFWIFFFAMVLFGISFLQFFSTVPLFYKEMHALSEFDIGLILGLNGLVIFIFEMPLVKYLEDSSFSMVKLILIGAILTALSFAVFNFTSWTGIVIISMLLMTIGEMISFPFSNAFALQRSQKGNPGEYMALYSISFSVSHIIGHNSGMQLVSYIGYTYTWYIIIALLSICIFLLYILQLRLTKEATV